MTAAISSRRDLLKNCSCPPGAASELPLPSKAQSVGGPGPAAPAPGWLAA